MTPKTQRALICILVGTGAFWGAGHILLRAYDRAMAGGLVEPAVVEQHTVLAKTRWYSTRHHAPIYWVHVDALDGGAPWQPSLAERVRAYFRGTIPSNGALELQVSPERWQALSVGSPILTLRCNNGALEDVGPGNLFGDKWLMVIETVVALGFFIFGSLCMIIAFGAFTRRRPQLEVATVPIKPRPKTRAAL